MRKKRNICVGLLFLIGIATLALSSGNFVRSYPVNEGTGNTITDKSGTLTLTNASGQTWVRGHRQANAAEFPAGSSNGAVTSSNDFNPSVTTRFSVQATYRYPSSSTCSIGVIPTGFLDVLTGTMGYYNNGSARGWNLSSDIRDGIVNLLVSSDNGDRMGFHFFPPDGELCDHHWHTVLMVYGGDALGNDVHTFWDGIEQTAIVDTWSNLNNGDNVVGSGNFFIGNDPTNSSPNPVDVEKVVLTIARCQ